jgi:hypothetical protein
VPAIVKDDPWWLDPNDPHRVAYTTQGLLDPTVPSAELFDHEFEEHMPVSGDECFVVSATT